MRALSQANADAIIPGVSDQNRNNYSLAHCARRIKVLREH